MEPHLRWSQLKCEQEQYTTMYKTSGFFTLHSDVRKWAVVSFLAIAFVTNATATKNQTCVDLHSLCPYWAFVKNECVDNAAFMLSNCPSACGRCSGADGKKIMLDCVDKYEECTELAAGGECELNPYFMLWQCSKSCKACDSAGFVAYPVLLEQLAKKQVQPTKPVPEGLTAPHQPPPPDENNPYAPPTLGPRPGESTRAGGSTEPIITGSTAGGKQQQQTKSTTRRQGSQGATGKGGQAQKGAGMGPIVLTAPPPTGSQGGPGQKEPGKTEPGQKDSSIPIKHGATQTGVTNVPTGTTWSATNLTKVTNRGGFAGGQFAAAAEGCVDDTPLCPFWSVRTDECKGPTLCNATCSSCSPKMVDMNCADLDVYCAPWAKLGECNHNPYFMFWKCPMSCKWCSRSGLNSIPDFEAILQGKSLTVPQTTGPVATPTPSPGTPPISPNITRPVVPSGNVTVSGIQSIYVTNPLSSVSQNVTASVVTPIYVTSPQPPASPTVTASAVSSIYVTSPQPPVSQNISGIVSSIYITSPKPSVSPNISGIVSSIYVTSPQPPVSPSISGIVSSIYVTSPQPPVSPSISGIVSSIYVTSPQPSVSPNVTSPAVSSIYVTSPQPSVSPANANVSEVAPIYVTSPQPAISIVSPAVNVTTPASHVSPEVSNVTSVHVTSPQPSITPLVSVPTGNVTLIYSTSVAQPNVTSPQPAVTLPSQNVSATSQSVGSIYATSPQPQVSQQGNVSTIYVTTPAPNVTTIHVSSPQPSSSTGPSPLVPANVSVSLVPTAVPTAVQTTALVNVSQIYFSSPQPTGPTSSLPPIGTLTQAIPTPLTIIVYLPCNASQIPSGPTPQIGSEPGKTGSVLVPTASVPIQTGSVPVPTGSVPAPTGSVLVPAGSTSPASNLSTVLPPVGPYE